MREMWEAVLSGMGAATLVATFLALVWRVAKPHVLGWVDRQLAPIRSDLEAVRSEVKPNGGASLKDAAAQAQESAVSADTKLDDLRATVHRVGRQVQRVEGLNTITAGVLDQHVRESSKYLRQLGHVFEELGIDAPQWGETEEDEDAEQ